jgi:aspartyl-tRNA(Asn)/glutamyl-tRNA(Gln) amidotransferase subunit A
LRHAVAAPSAAELAASVRAGRVTAAQLVEDALDRLREVDDDVRAFVEVDADAARQQARRCADGPLHGVPVGVKDLFDVAGQTTRAGSRVPPGAPAHEDAVAVARLRAAGAVVLGRTRTHEFAWGITTQHEVLGGTRNPWATDRVPGGSSGGSAAAVAAGIVPLALGTDTGCSIRLPSAWCGLVGHKPSWGAVPLEGCVPLAPSLDHGGALVRTVPDVRLVLEVLTGLALRPPAPVRGLRAGVVRAPATAGVTRALEDAYRRAEAAGLLLHEVDLPLADQLVATYVGVQAGEALAWHRGSGRWPAHAEAYGRDVRSYLERADARPVPGVTQRRAELRQQVAALFRTADVLLLPVATAGPPATSDADTAVGPTGPVPVRDTVLPWTVLANLCGLPACSVPAGMDDDGLPVGVQVVGAPGTDARVLDVAEQLQAPLEP